MSMDDAKNPYRQSFDEPIAPQRGRANVLGIVGFVLAFCLPPLGLLLSIIAAFKAPRGFAIAGIIIGLIGTTIVAVVALGFGVAGKYMVNGVEFVIDTQQIGQSASAYASANNGAAPPDLATLQLPTDTITDPWGQPYRFTPGESGAWTLQSAGIDATWGTTDDITIDSTMSDNERGNVFGKSVEEHFKARQSGATP
jgi:hypothetical protein